jgi:F-type H+-transporting ATPase subunit delta
MAAFVARYAHAFLDVANTAKLNSAAIDAQLTDFLATWNDSRELREFFINPAVPSLQKIAVLDAMNKKLGMSKELRNLIAVLIDNDRIGAVAEVAQAYRKLVQQQSGISQAEIVTARKLSAEDRKLLVTEVGKLAGGRVDATFRIDEAILGGTVVRIGSTVYDGSVRGRLDRLKDALTANG